MRNTRRLQPGEHEFYLRVIVADHVSDETVFVALEDAPAEIYVVPATDAPGAVEALRAVHAEGGVCDQYEICGHRACQSSYAAWAIADAYLTGQSETPPAVDEGLLPGENHG